MGEGDPTLIIIVTTNQHTTVFGWKTYCFHAVPMSKVHAHCFRRVFEHGKATYVVVGLVMSKDRYMVVFCRWRQKQELVDLVLLPWSITVIRNLTCTEHSHVRDKGSEVGALLVAHCGTAQDTNTF